MPYLADSLSRYEDRPVVDMTGLTGTTADGRFAYNLDDVQQLILIVGLPASACRRGKPMLAKPAFPFSIPCRRWASG